MANIEQGILKFEVPCSLFWIYFCANVLDQSAYLLRVPRTLEVDIALIFSFIIATFAAAFFN